MLIDTILCSRKLLFYYFMTFNGSPPGAIIYAPVVVFSLGFDSLLPSLPPGCWAPLFPLCWNAALLARAACTYLTYESASSFSNSLCPSTFLQSEKQKPTEWNLLHNLCPFFSLGFVMFRTFAGWKTIRSCSSSLSLAASIVWELKTLVFLPSNC